jgi:hypothetical protein
VYCALPPLAANTSEQPNSTSSSTCTVIFPL